MTLTRQARNAQILDLLGSAARALEQGRELTPAESAAAEAYASAVARESAGQ